MYKIIHDNKVIDVVREPRFLKFVSPHNVVLTNKTLAQGLVGSDNKTLYSFEPIPQRELLIVTIEAITEDDFNRLQTLLNLGQEISADESELAKAKQTVLRRLSNACKNKITNGFSITLSDKNTYSFSLTTEDQLNLTTIENRLNAGDTRFIYHADGKPCQIFDREDMTRIISSFRQHVLYHTTYYNAAKQYINAQTDIEKVCLFTYGIDVSEVTDDIVLKQILKKGGNLA